MGEIRKRGPHLLDSLLQGRPAHRGEQPYLDLNGESKPRL